MKIRRKIIGVSVIMILLMVTVPYVSAGVTSVIDKSNWQQIQGLLPAPALEWVKKGDLIMRVGTVNYDPVDCAPVWVAESKKENIGKYDLDKENMIVDVKTGKMPRFIKGIPFPAIDANDPTAATKIMYNGSYMRNSMGGLRCLTKIRLIGRRGFERLVAMDFYSLPLDGWGPAADLPNPDDVSEMVQVVVREPYDMAGTAIMNWRYRTKPDIFFGYLPSIRRVRRMSPAERTDPMFGTEIARDDGGYANYDGAVPLFQWKLLGKAEILGEYLNEDVVRTFETPKGEWAMDTKGKRVTTYGYETKGWTGAPWHVTNAIWVKRPVWVIEGRPKDPYYNYGKVIHYIDTESFLGYWKVIHDRADKYWKMYWPGWVVAQSDDKKHNVALILAQAYDERADHASSMDIAEGTKLPYWCGAKYGSDQFTLSGFTKICK